MGQRLAWARGGSAAARPGHPDKAFPHPAGGAAPRMPSAPPSPPPCSLTNTLASPPARHGGLGRGPGKEFCGVSPPSRTGTENSKSNLQYWKPGWRRRQSCDLVPGLFPSRHNCQSRLSAMRDYYPMPPYSEGCYGTDNFTY